MLSEEPQWTFNSKKPLTKWYGHVHLLSNKVVGQWFCVDRASGRVDWQRTFFRPTTVAGFDSSVIVASETRADGPWTASFGCYGISLADGRLLWTSHRSGLWGRVVRLLDFIPGFTNELRDTSHHVEDGKVYCDSGRVLDVRTGRLLKRIDPEAVHSYKKQASISHQLYHSGLERTHPRIEVEDGLFLRHAQEAEGWQRGTLEIAAETAPGNLLWTFSVKQLGRHTESNFYSYRLVPPFIYLVVSEEPNRKPHPTEKHWALPNPTRWHVVTLDLASGKVVQDFPLGDEKWEECRIENVDKHGLLISTSKQCLMYFGRTGTPETSVSERHQQPATNGDDEK